MPIRTKYYTTQGFKTIYEDDIIEIFKILNSEIIEKKYQVFDKQKLFKNILEYIYIHSDTRKLNVD